MTTLKQHDRHFEQMPVRIVSELWIMRSRDFVAGVEDKRAGQPPRYDNFMFDQSDGAAVAKAMIDAHWNYERGRQWASIAPLSMPLKTGGKLNPKAVALYRAASRRGFTL